MHCTASASEDKITRCVELLLSRNADPNVVDRSQMTSLMLAAREGYSKVINLLVAHGAELDVQDNSGYTALAVAVKYGREKAVLKLLQLGADKTIKTKSGKSPVDLAEFFNLSLKWLVFCNITHLKLGLTFFSSKTCVVLSVLLSVTRLNDLELLLHGLNLSHLTEVMTVSIHFHTDIRLQIFLCIGITDPEDQQKVLNVVQQIHLDKIDLNTLCQLCEDLQNFLISVNHQCCYLIEVIHDVVSRFPRQTSQLVFSLDSGKEAQSTCSQLVLQIKDLEKEVSCLHSLLCKVSNCLHLPYFLDYKPLLLSQTFDPAAYPMMRLIYACI
uniref:Ankyrin repeat, SAM and basic leucine zipper domain containing 1 n=1 Tax=Oryzias sinensis TaxID=183150 RepID=A0A8C7ZNA1_9TELE